MTHPNTVVGFQLPGEPSPEEKDSYLSNYPGTSPPMPFGVAPPPPWFGRPRRSSATAAQDSAFPDGQASLSRESSVNPSNVITSETGPSSVVPSISTASVPGSSVTYATTATSSTSTPTAAAAEAAAVTEAERKAQLKAERKAAKEAELAAQGLGGKKQLTKEERRAKQEAERAAKAAKSTPSAPAAKAPMPPKAPPSNPPSRTTSSAAAVTAPPPPAPAAPPSRTSELFLHLKDRVDIESPSWLTNVLTQNPPVHREILALGRAHHLLEIVGGTARTRSMLEILRSVVRDYQTPSGKVPSRDLVSHISTQISFLAECRNPLGTGMGNAVKYLKMHMSRMEPTMPEQQVKDQVLEHIDSFLRVKIALAQQEVVSTAVQRIQEGDVILTLARSELVLKSLIAAHKLLNSTPRTAPAAAAASAATSLPPAEEQHKFTVIVVGTEETNEGLLMAKALHTAGLQVIYKASVNQVASVLPHTTKVFLGAAAVLASGTVLTRTGAAVLACMAQREMKPVTVLCESFKFHDRVQVSSSSHNELGDCWTPTRIAHLPGTPNPSTPRKVWEESSVKLLVTRYDSVMPEYVDKIMCEHGEIPTTGVLNFLRESRRGDTHTHM